MLAEFRRFNNNLFASLSIKGKTLNALELLKINDFLEKERHLFEESICDKIMSLSQVNKKEILGYCLDQLANKSVPDTYGMPWWIICNSVYSSRYYSAKTKLLLSIPMQYDKAERMLDKLADYCSNNERWTSQGIDWRIADNALTSVINYCLDDLNDFQYNLLRDNTLDEKVFAICAAEIALSERYKALLKISELYEYFTYGVYNEHYPHAKWHDTFSVLCNHILNSFPREKNDSNFSEFISFIFDALANRKEEIQKWLFELDKLGTREDNYLTKVVNSESNIVQAENERNIENIHLPSLLWNGKVSELLDLFVTLQDKGYIQLPNSGFSPGPTWEIICKNICSLFDISKARRADSKTEPWRTLETYFKSRSQDKITREMSYDKINYNKRKFEDIPPSIPTHDDL